MNAARFQSLSLTRFIPLPHIQNQPGPHYAIQPGNAGNAMTITHKMLGRGTPLGLRAPVGPNPTVALQPSSVTPWGTLNCAQDHSDVKYLHLCDKQQCV